MNLQEKKQVDILVMVLKKFDVEFFKERALRVLDENPRNKLALMIFNAEFEVALSNYGTVLSVRFNEKAVEEYLDSCGNEFDLETFMIIAKLVAMKQSGGVDADADIFCALINRANLNCDKRSLEMFYDSMAFWICSNSKLVELKTHMDINRDESIMKSFAANSALDAKARLAYVVFEQLKQQNALSQEKRNQLMVKIASSGLIPELNKSQNKKKISGIIGIVIGASIIALIIIFLTFV